MLISRAGVLPAAEGGAEAGGEEKRKMGNKLFVGGLAWATTDESLRTAFEQFGEVSEAKVITDRETGRSRGFGFVTLSTDEEAQAAQEAMDGSDLDGRTVRVNEAHEPRDRCPAL